MTSTARLAPRFRSVLGLAPRGVRSNLEEQESGVLGFLWGREPHLGLRPWACHLALPVLGSVTLRAGVSPLSFHTPQRPFTKALLLGLPGRLGEASP